MKKTLIALAVLGTAVGVAHAQSNVTVYGVVDTGYVKTTGQDLKMDENVNSRIGFKGAEDLGGGLKAIFQLEKRFNVHDGTNNSDANKDWEGAANVGLASDSWGKIRFGRVNELTTETIRKFDPFYQYGVGGMIESTQRSARIDNTARYDSPKWAGFSFGLSYSLGKDTKSDGKWYELDTGTKKYAYDNDGYGINLSYDNGPFMATANWSRLADSNDSDVWNIGVAYKFGSARVMLSYEKTKDEGFKAGGYSMYDDNRYANTNFKYFDNNGVVAGLSPVSSEQESWLLGLEWDVGPGQFDAAIQRVSIDDVRSLYTGQKGAFVSPGSVNLGTSDTYKKVDGDVMKYSIGYTYNLSKRTSVYGQIAYTDWDTEAVNEFYGGTGRESTTDVQIGITHKF